MRLILCSIISLCAVGALPRYYRQTPQVAAPFARQALFIPEGEMPEDFNPSQPIPGSFFVPRPIEVAAPQSAAPASSAPPVSIPLPFAAGTQQKNGDVTNDDAVTMEPLVTTTAEPRPLPAVVEGIRVGPGASSSALPAASSSPVDKNVDLDRNGILSLPEVQYAAFVHHGLSGSVVEGMFKQVDANADGELSADEFNKIRPMVIEKSENAALRYMQSVDLDKNKLLSLAEAQHYLLKEYGIGSRDVERIWLLVVPDTSIEMDAAQFSKLRRRIRGMTIRLARQIMKSADANGDGHISLDEAQAIAFEQEGIGAGDVAQMMASVDDNGDGELNAPEFADFERIVRARAIDTSRKALKVVDADGSNSLTMDEAKRIAFEHYGFDENVLRPFFDQADENEDGQLDAVEFAGFRSVIRARAVKNALAVLKEVDLDGDGLVSLAEAAEKTRAEDDMEENETRALFNIADQNKSGKLDKVELADFVRLVRLSAIKFATDHFKEFDSNGDRLVTVDELATLIQGKYGVPDTITARYFEKVDVDGSLDLIPAEIVDFRHEIRNYVSSHADVARISQDAAVVPPQEQHHARPPPRMHPITSKTTHEEEGEGNEEGEEEWSMSPEATSHPATTTTAVSTTRLQTTEPTRLTETAMVEMETQPTTTTRRKMKFQKSTERIHEEPTATTIRTSSSSERMSDPTLIPEEVTDLPPTKQSRQPRIWKHHRHTTELRDQTTHSTEQTTEWRVQTTEPTVVVTNPTVASTSMSTTSASTSTSTTPSTSTTTERPTTMSTITSTTNRISTTTTSNKSNDEEYEVVEVEVDEQGNEIERDVEREQRKMLIEKQKKEMNIPANEEVEYVEADPTTKSPEDYEVVEYVEEEESTTTAKPRL